MPSFSFSLSLSVFQNIYLFFKVAIGNFLFGLQSPDQITETLSLVPRGKGCPCNLQPPCALHIPAPRRMTGRHQGHSQAGREKQWSGAMYSKLAVLGLYCGTCGLPLTVILGGSCISRVRYGAERGELKSVSSSKHNQASAFHPWHLLSFRWGMGH